MSDTRIGDLFLPSALPHLRNGFSPLYTQPPLQASTENFPNLVDVFTCCWARNPVGGETDIRAQYAGLANHLIRNIGFSTSTLYLSCLCEYDLENIHVLGHKLPNSSLNSELTRWKKEFLVLSSAKVDLEDLCRRGDALLLFRSDEAAREQDAAFLYAVQQEREMAEQERERAEQERERAEQERERAELERERADRLQAQLDPQSSRRLPDGETPPAEPVTLSRPPDHHVQDGSEGHVWSVGGDSHTVGDAHHIEASDTHGLEDGVRHGATVRHDNDAIRRSRRVSRRVDYLAGLARLRAQRPRQSTPDDTLPELVQEIRDYLHTINCIDDDGNIDPTDIDTLAESLSTTVSTQYGVHFADICVVLECHPAQELDTYVPLGTGEVKFCNVDPSGVTGLHTAAAMALRQEIYYALGTHDKCNTQFGFVCVNQRFARLVILGPNRLALEVSDPAVSSTVQGAETDPYIETLDVDVLCRSPATLALYHRFPWDLFNYTIPPQEWSDRSAAYIKTKLTLNQVSLEAYWDLIRAGLARLAKVTLDSLLTELQSSHTEPPAPLAADEQDDSPVSCPRPDLGVDLDNHSARRALANAVRPQLKSLEACRTGAVTARNRLRSILSRLEQEVQIDESMSGSADDPDTSMDSDLPLAKRSAKRTRSENKAENRGDESGRAKRQKGAESRERPDDRTDRDDDGKDQPANPVGSSAEATWAASSPEASQATRSESSAPSRSSAALDELGSPEPRTPPESNARHVPPAIDAASAAKLDCASPALPSATVSTLSGKSQTSTNAIETSTTLVGSSPSTEFHKVVPIMPSVQPQPKVNDVLVPVPGHKDPPTGASSAAAAAEDPFPEEDPNRRDRLPYFDEHTFDDMNPLEVSSAREHLIVSELRKRNPVIELWSTAKLDAYLKAVPS